MTALQLEVLEAFRAIDIPEDKAARAAAALSSAYTKFEADIGTNLHKRDTEIGKDVSAIRSALSEAREDVSAIRNDFSEMRRDVSQLREELSETRRDVSELRKDHSETRRDVSSLREDLSETRREVSDIRKDMTGVKLEIASVRGEVALQRWMLGFNITLTLLGFGSVLGFLWRFVK